MTFLEKLRTIEQIDQLIRMKATGAADELANRVGISKSTLYEYIQIMKYMNAPIKYCKTKNSFVYESKAYFSFGFFQDNQIETLKIKGGKKKDFNFFEESDFFGKMGFIFNLESKL